MEFDRHCGTAQSEDCLQLYIPAVTLHNSNNTTASTTTSTAAAAAAAAAVDDDDDGGGDGGVDGGTDVSAWWPVLSKFHGTDGWPTSAVILPGDALAHCLPGDTLAHCLL